MDNYRRMLDVYIEDIKGEPRITPKRELELADIIQNSSDKEAVKKAKDELVLSNLMLVVKLALDTYPKIRDFEDVNLSLMDLVEEGNIGLMRAAELFKTEPGVRFSTYAYISIRRAIKRGIRASRMIRLPMHHFKYITHLKDVEALEGGKALSDKELLEALDISQDMLDIIRKNKNGKVAIEDLEALSDNVKRNSDEEYVSVPEIVSNRELKNYLYEKMKELRPMHRDAIFMRYFGNAEMSLESIGLKLGVSMERARQIIMEGLKSLRMKIEEERARNRLDEPMKKGKEREIK